MRESAAGPQPPGAFAALLALFAARPGSWIEKPRPYGWAAAGPRFRDLPLGAALGLDAGGGDFVYLTDTAEFERLGVYELIRRRCRYIIALDSGGDGLPDRLETLIRRCRIDFGLRVAIDARPLDPPAADRLMKVEVAVGQIHYGDIDRDASPGVLVYVRPLSSGGQVASVPAVAGNAPRTARQPSSVQRAFDEQEFERCRTLGCHAASVVFGEVVARVGELSRDLAGQPHDEFASRVFKAVIKRWSEGAASDGEAGAAAPSEGAPSLPASAGRGRRRALPGADAPTGGG